MPDIKDVEQLNIETRIASTTIDSFQWAGHEEMPIHWIHKPVGDKMALEEGAGVIVTYDKDGNPTGDQFVYPDDWVVMKAGTNAVKVFTDDEYHQMFVGAGEGEMSRGELQSEVETLTKLMWAMIERSTEKSVLIKAEELKAIPEDASLRRSILPISDSVVIRSSKVGSE